MSGYQVILLPMAEETLLEIAEYIALDNPVRALSFIEEMTASLRKTLSVFPFSGRLYDGLGAEMGVRTFPYGNYLSYYRVKEQERRVEILFVFNAKREISRFLEELD